MSTLVEVDLSKSKKWHGKVGSESLQGQRKCKH
jgi:hypothetical protein